MVIASYLSTKLEEAGFVAVLLKHLLLFLTSFNCVCCVFALLYIELFVVIMEFILSHH